MQQRIYNQFYPGVQQDDFLTNWPWFIEHKNINGLKDWYGITLWPKVNKLLTTNEPIRGMSFFQTLTPDLNRSIFGGDNGEIYRGDSTDGVPEFTLSNWGHIIAIEELSNFYFIFYKLDKTSVNIWLARINSAAAWVGDWDLIEEEFLVWEFRHVWIPPILSLGNFLYVWDVSSVKRIDVNGTPINYWFPDSDVVWITAQGYTLVVYCEWGQVFLWDWATATNTNLKQFWSRLSKVTSKGWIDYIVTENGQYWIGQGLWFQRVTKTKFSNRMNSPTYDRRLDFATDEPDGLQNHSILWADDDVYVYASDTVKGIYRYGSLIPWLQDWLHKIVTQNHEWIPIDYVYDMFFYERTDRRIYFSYKAGSTYWIDYIDLNNLETCTDWYAITEIFSWGTTFKKKINRIRRATSNTSWDNYIKVYYRVDNQDWILIRNINDENDIILRENIHVDSEKKPFKELIDVQLKIELHSETWSEDSPTLHELMIEYEAIET